VKREGAGRFAGPVDAWLGAHRGAAALVLIVLGFLVRMMAARRSFVIADEMFYANLAGSESLGEVFRASLAQDVHPPLFVLLLHLWMGIVGIGWQLCWLPVAFATLFLWASYRWVHALFGAAAALAALALLALLPQLVLLTAEVRGYAMLLCFAAAALAALERGLAEKSVRWLGIASALGGLALLTHYGAARLVATMFVYGTIRLLAARAPVRLAVGWVVSQAALGALFLVLFLHQLSRVRGGSHEQYAQAEWLKASYFRPQLESAWTFVTRQTAAFFEWFLMSRWAGLLAILLTLAGIVWLAAEKSPAALLLGLPFLLAAIGGLLRVYPYGGSRHSIDLALFASGAMALALSRLTGERLWVGAALGVALIPAALAVGW
jgi:uncharacterized membrane protein